MTEITPAQERKCISIIVPAKNEEENVPRLYEELTRVMSPLPYDYEVIVIDNCSADKTGELAEELCERDNRWKYLRFSRDFTAEISIAAGLEYCTGDAAIVLFSDLQDPVDRIPDLIGKWEEGNDIVYGRLKNRRDDSWLRSMAVAMGYFVISKLSDVQIPPNATDFRLYSRDVIDAIKSMHERSRYMRGFAHWVGFKSAPLEYDRNPRKAGRTKAPFYFLIVFALQDSGRLRGHQNGVRGLENEMLREGYSQVPPGMARPGDVWISNARSHTELVSAYGGTRTIGSNNDMPGHQVISEHNRNPASGVYYHLNTMG